MKIRLPLAAMTTLLAAGGLQAAEPAEAVSNVAEDARLRTARLILDITNPYDQMVDANMVGWEVAARKAMSLDPTAARLEKAHPGLFDAVVDACRPSARTYFGKVVAQMLAYKARIVASRLTAGELDKMLRFFRSAPGRRAVRGLYANMDPARTGSDIAVDRAAGKATVTAEYAEKVERAATVGMMAQASAEDKAVLLRFARSTANRKYTAASREADVKLLEMVNNPDPEWVAGQRDKTEAAATAFLEARIRR